MRPRGSISTSAIHFVISKTVSAVPADATEVPTSRHKSSSTNDLAATLPQSGSNFQKCFRNHFSSPPLRPEKYAESIGEIRFQIRSQSPEMQSAGTTIKQSYSVSVPSVTNNVYWSAVPAPKYLPERRSAAFRHHYSPAKFIYP